MEPEPRQYDFPVKLGDNHVVIDSMDYVGDRFECDGNDETAYMHTGAWVAWNHCPFCGAALESAE